MSRIYELRLMARVAQLYHENNLKQAEISKQLHLSQATVSRLLSRAVDEGIVRITINAPRGTYPQLEDQLRDRYGLAEAVVAECYEDHEEAILPAIGNAAAYYFESTVSPDEVIGISCWSSALLHMVDAVHPVKRLKAEKVIQIVGGIGTLEPSYMLHNSGNTFAADELADLRERGVVGDICMRFFDANGRIIDSPFDERVIGITLPELKAVPHVIGVAGSARKTATIHAALIGGWVDTLVTDKFTAERLLSLPHPPNT